MKRVFFLIFLGLVLWSPRSSASIEYCRVIDVSGRTEILESGSAAWAPLGAPRLLKGGDKIRTADKSYAEISTSDDFSGLLRLGANSQMEVMGEDLARFFLRRGMLMALREEDDDTLVGRPAEKLLLQIFTRDLSAGILLGGYSVSVSDRGTWVRVFSEHAHARIFMKENKKAAEFKRIPEGFKYFWGSDDEIGPLGPSRMYYSDYTEWQFWVRKCYERQDARSDALILKG